MADNVIANSGDGLGPTFATDDDGTAQHPYTKLEWGADNTFTKVSTGASALPIQDGGNSITVDDGSSSLTIDNATLAVTGGGVEATALRVTLASDSTGVLSVDDNGGSLTVDGTVTETNSAAILADTANMDTNLGTIAGAVSGTEMQVDVVSIPTVTVTGTITANLGATDNAVLDTIASPVATISATPLTRVAIFDASDAQITSFGGGTQYTEGNTDASITGTAMLMEGAADTLVAAQGTVADGLLVNLGSNNDVTVTGTVDLGATDNAVLDSIAATLVTIDSDTSALVAAVSGSELQVDVITLPNVTLAAGTNTNEVVGDVAHDAAVSGNPVLIAGSAQTMDDTAPPNRVSAESDATRIATSLDGGVFVHPHGPQVWSYHVDGSSALTDTTVHAAPGAGLSLYVTDIVVSSGAATAMNVFFEESTTKVLGPYYLEAVAGRGLALHFQTPKKITANTALTVTTSAAIAHSVDVTGFTAPA